MTALVILAILLVVLFSVVIGNKDGKVQKKDNGPSSPKLDNRAMMDIARKIGQNEHGNYWQGFKVRKPQDAKAIETLCGRDMETLTDANAFQIVSSFSRWSKNSGTPIANLKDDFIEQMKSLIADGTTFDMLISRMKYEKSKEAKQFNISEDFTICSFMYEWLVEMKNEQERDLVMERFAKNLNIPPDRMDSFKEEIRRIEEEQNLAPNISQLDREENKLFALANEGVSHLTEISPLADDNKTYRLNENGKFEARILCSTIVIDLHSHFKNEINLDVQADRYFLLLADSITGDYPDEEIDFINSRIAFYNDSIKSIKDEPYSKVTDSLLAKIFNLLYLNPLSSSDNEIEKGTISRDVVSAFKIEMEDVIKEMEVGRLLITSERAHSVKLQFLSVLKSMIPESKRELLNQDAAWLFADQALEMIKSGDIDDRIASILPQNVVSQIKRLSSICKGNDELSPEQIDNILNNAKDEYIKTFNK
jgi:hypothetical protein